MDGQKQKGRAQEQHAQGMGEHKYRKRAMHRFSLLWLETVYACRDGISMYESRSIVASAVNASGISARLCPHLSFPASANRQVSAREATVFCVKRFAMGFCP
jgi:hypothetical protein